MSPTPDPRPPIPGLYVHIPFCSAICNYCNFNRGLFDADLKERYLAALLRDVEDAPFRWPGVFDRPAPDTLYFGGGTPSLLEPGEIARIIMACRRTLRLSDDAEITLEANPDTVTLDRLARYRGAGVNRLSVGVHSFRDEELRRLGRLHDAARAAEVVGWARTAGFGNISLDLMMWLPQQTVPQWLDSVARLIELAPDHASVYLLEVYPQAPLREEMARAGWSQAPDEDAEAMYGLGMERMEAAGFRQYEISNLATPGKGSRHNLKYWSDGEWLAFGCGAHSTLDAARWRNVPSIVEYISRIQAGVSTVIDHRALTSDERLEDALFMGLRLSEGVDLSEMADRYGVDVWAAYGEQLTPHVEAGLVVKAGHRLWLTRKGMLLAHEVMAVFV